MKRGIRRLNTMVHQRVGVDAQGGLSVALGDLPFNPQPYLRHDQR